MLLSRSAATLNQRLFALYLPGAELTLHASVHSSAVAERQMLVEALELLGPDDVLVLDRGYPAAWLIALLNARGIRFVMRCDGSGGNAARRFLRSGAEEAVVKFKNPAPPKCVSGPARPRLHRSAWCAKPPTTACCACSSPT